ncbi:hypothetical protein [Thermotoga sp. KOL6]|uniref:hypothetical protein n=1 Tax=Thermotoga sp. KOL6 TaxID=126741 RepID=UPI000C772592|nr:hypothetical protein [Thermotoga sp. KOL6]PLV58698.1 hypothetical protein AS005_07375 [Thermotoga sp. KOL6]
MKRTLLLAIVVIPLFIFALDVEKVMSHYEEMLKEYESESYQDPFVGYVLDNLPQLQKYRFFRKLLVGSVEKTEFAKTTGDYLFVLYKDWEEKSWEKKLANALFLAYIQSEMSGINPSKSSLKNSPSFNSFFAEYKSYVRSNVLNLFRWILAYYTGGIDTPPPVEFSLEVRNMGFVFNVNREISPDVLRLLPRNLEANLLESIKTVLNSRNQAEYRRNINRQASLLWRDVEDRISAIQNEVADSFETASPKKRNFLWFRYLMYGIVLLLFRRKYKAVLQLILASEIIFIWLSNTSHLNTIGNMIFAIFLTFAFIFINLQLLRERRYLYTLLTLTFLISFFVPSYISVKELGIDSKFEESPYYDQLKSDVFEDDSSRIKSVLREMSSISLASKEHTKQIVEYLGLFPEKLLENEALKSLELTSKGIFIQINERSQFFSTSNFEERLKLADDVANMLRDYLSQEKSRSKRYKSALKELDHLSQRIFSYTSEKFAEDFEAEIMETLKKYPLITDVSLTPSEEKKYPSLKPYQTLSGLKEIFWFFLLYFSILIGGRYAVFPIVAVLFATVSTIARWKQLEVFVESGIFPMITETSAFHTFHMETFLIALSLIFLYKIFKKRRVKL